MVFYKYFFLVLAAILLSACSDFDSINTGSTGYSSGDGQYVTTVLHGSVGDGPVIGASIKVYSRDGELLAEHTSDSTANYNLKVAAKKSAYPLTVTSTGGLDIVTRREPDFTMTSYVQNPGDRKRTNINPFSTLIHKTAKAMDNGLTAENIEKSKGHVLKYLNFGFDSSVMLDPVTTPVDKNNVALIIRSSEMVGEMVRRTRDRMRSRQPTINGNTILDSLAADMTDGAVDGAGAAGADLRIAAVANVASMQVQVEAMRGELKVNGVDAKVLMNDAIKTSLPTEQVDTTVYDVAINAEMIDQAKTILRTVKVLDSNTIYTDVESELEKVMAGMLPADADDVLSVDAINSLDTTLETTVNADDQTLVAANTVITNQEPSPEPTPGPTATNTVPSIGGIPATNVQEGDSYYFAPVASDADGDVLSFSIVNKPSWASFNTATGAINGAPATGDVGLTSGIGISASDGIATVSLPAFNLTVSAIPNSAPTISGSPATGVQVGSAYSFIPTSVDADSDTLSFSIINKPAWASFNTSTGQLSGTPASNNVGSTANISISVTDGIVSASLPDFSINVADAVASTGSAALSWLPPTENTDGTALSNIAGYKIYYGTSVGNYTSTVNIGNGGLTSYVVDNLAGNNTYYFVMTAYDASGNESGYSNIGSKTIQ